MVAPGGKVQGGFPAAMIAKADAGLPVVSVSADLQGSTGARPFHARFRSLVLMSVLLSPTWSRLPHFLSRVTSVVDTFVQFGVTMAICHW